MNRTLARAHPYAHHAPRAARALRGCVSELFALSGAEPGSLDVYVTAPDSPAHMRLECERLLEDALAELLLGLPSDKHGEVRTLVEAAKAAVRRIEIAAQPDSLVRAPLFGDLPMGRA